MADKAEDIYTRRLGEDERHILDHCPILARMLDQEPTFRADDQVYGLMSNVHVRPLVTAAVLGASGLGLAASEGILSGLTRQIFDGPHLVGGTLQQLITGVVGGDRVAAVNRFMDTVPGSDAMGGGWLHRLQHGHDAGALAEVWREHGSAGGLQALYHVAGRDFFTPAGVPILPVGSDGVLSFLTDRMGLRPVQAADLISINAVELLAGVALLTSVVRFAGVIRAALEDARIRRDVQLAVEAAGQEDYLTATSLMSSVVAQRPGDFGLAYTKALIHHRAGQDLAAHFAYMDTVRLTSGERPVVTVGGAALSLRGLAGMGALATSSALAKSPEHEAGWLDHVVQVSKTTAMSFEAVARDIADQRLISQVQVGSLLPGRLLSGALNHYLAGQVAGTTMILPDRESILHASRTQFQSVLAKLPTSRDYLDEEHRKQIEFVSAFGSAQLAPVTAGGELSS